METANESESRDDSSKQVIVAGHDKQKIEAISTASRWWSTSRDYPAFTANSKSIHEQGFMNSGEVINPRCPENRGSA